MDESCYVKIVILFGVKGGAVLRLINADALKDGIADRYDLHYGETLINPKEFYDLVDDFSEDYSIDKVIGLLEDYGKYKGILTPTWDGEFDNFISVSDAKRIVREQKI